MGLKDESRGHSILHEKVALKIDVAERARALESVRISFELEPF